MIFLRTLFSIAFLLFVACTLPGQSVIFSEDFEPVAGPEYNGATTGTSTEGYIWNTSCPSCIPTGDFFETRLGQLRGNDTNGPAFFTANGIDATGCLLVTFQFDYNSVGYSGGGNLECAAECDFSGPPGCSGDPSDAISNSDCNNCWDFLSWEINSGSITDDNVVLGLDCNASASGSVESAPLCVNQPGADPSNVNIVITMSMWATNEWMEFDNITILCYTEQEAIDNGIPIPAVCANCMVTIDDVTTVDLTCSDSDDGEITIDATGSSLSGSLEYSINNGSSFQSSDTFTGLMAGTYDIVVQDDADSGCFATTSVTINAPPPLVASAPPPLIVCYQIFPPDGELLNQDEVIDAITNFDPTLTVNWYFDMAGTSPLDPTDPDDIFTLINNGQTTIYATVVEGVCESNTVPVVLDLNEYPQPADASLEVCDDGSGQGTFDLTSIENTVLNGQSGTVIFYEDVGLNNEIFTPGNYTSGTSTIFAVIDNGSGCIGDPAQIMLDLITIDPNDLFLSFSPSSACGNAIIAVTINTPSSPPGDYTFEVSYGPVSSGPNNNITLIGMDGATNFNLGISESHIFVINDVTGPGPSFCPVTFSPPLEFIVPIDAGPDAFPASITACPNQFGEGEFDLTTLEDIINDFTNLPVDFYEDIDLNFPVNGPNNYVSGPATIYAVVDGGSGCFSAPVEITLLIEEAPDPVDFFLDIVDNCDPTTVTLTFDLPNGDAFDFDLIIDDNNGTTFSFFTGVMNNDQLSFPVTETTTFSIEEITTSSGCTFQLSPGPSGTINISGGVPANPASLDACDSGDGTATFDLTQENETVNGNTGETVLWYTDQAGTMPINFPDNFTSSGETVYAAVQVGACTSPTAEVVLTVFDLPEVMINIDTPIDCIGESSGAISVNVVSGPMPYTFDWNDNTYDGQQVLSGLDAGLYALTFTDGNGCETFADINLMEPPALDLVCMVVNDETSPGANDGQVSFDISGGSPLYDANLTGPVNATLTDLAANSYIFSNLAPGDYVLTITDDNDCTTECLFSIEATACILDFTLTPTDISCNGADDGSIVVVIAAGVPSYQYDWSDDQYDGMDQLMNLPPGDYTLTITDMDGCTLEQTTNISEPTPLSLDCRANMAGQGSGPDSYTFTFSGGTPFYQLDLAGPVNVNFVENMPGTWDTAVLPPGSYTFTLTDDNNCSESCSFVIDPNCDLNLMLTGTDPSCPGSADGTLNLVINSSQTITDIDWNDDTLDDMTTANTLTAGTYSVMVTDQAGCTQTASITLNDPAAIVVDCSNITNPSNAAANDGSIDVAVSSGLAPYTISWVGPTSGSAMLSNAGNLLIDNLGIGDYTITVEDASGCTVSCMASLTATVCDLMLDLQGTNPNCANTATGSLDLFIDSSSPIVTIDWNVDAFDGTEDHMNVAAGMYEVTVTDAAGCTATTSLTLVDPPAIFVNCSQVTHPTTPAGTNGGVDVILAGGNPPYMVSWNGPVMGMTTVNTPGTLSISNLSVGPYTITVEDSNGCQETCSFVMINNENCNFSITLFGTDPTCNGATDGVINLQLIEGEPDYTFTWNDSSLDSQGPNGNQTNLGAGNYTVTVTDNSNCVATGSFELTEPDAIIFTCTTTTQPSDGTATDGVITIDFTSGPGGPYTLSYDNGNGTMGSMPIVPGTSTVDNLPVGTYTIIISDGTCEEECMTALVDNSCTFALSIDHTNEQCLGANDGTATAMPSGGTMPYTYAWSNMQDTQQITNLAPGNYTVTVTDNAACIATASVSILQGQATPTLTSGGGTTICADSCYQLPVSFTGAPPFDLTYQLNFGASTLDFQDNFTSLEDSILICPAAIGIPAGSFTLTFTLLEDNLCQSTLNETVPFTYLPPAIGDLTTTICLEDSVMVGNEVFTFSNPNGEAVLPGAASSGCDSTVMVNLSFFPPSTSLIEDAICPGDTAMYGGEAFFVGNSVGTIVLENASSNGCDSTITVNLMELSAGINNVNDDLCVGDTLLIAGEVFDENRLSDTLELADQAANGCDSLIIVDLTLIPLVPNQIMPLLCEGDSLMVGDSILRDAGVYDILLPNAAANGCDSLIVVDLTLIPLVANPITSFICEGDSLMIGDSTLSEIGIYDVLLPNAAANGCDSLVQVDLSFYPVAESLLEGTFCAGEEVMVGDSLFTIDNSSGTVVLPDASSNGCDSLVVVDLLFLPNTLSNLDTLLCFGGSLSIGNQTFDQQNPSGIVILENAAANGCDSTIFVNTTYRQELFASIAPDTVVCGNQSIDAVITLSPGDTYDISAAFTPGFVINLQDLEGDVYSFNLGAIDSDVILTLDEVETGSGCPVTITNNLATVQYSNSQLTLNSIGGNGTADISCANSTDGSVAAQIQGGVGPFQYLWNTGDDSPSLNNLGPGTYSLTVTDAPGCTVEETITLTAPLALEGVVNGASAGCFGTNTGSISIDTIWGGTGPYEYSLENEFFTGVGSFPTLLPDLAAGPYTIYLQDANDCQTEISTAVPAGQQLMLELGDDETIKLGDSVLLDPQFDFVPNSWNWTPTAGLSQPDTFITYAAPQETTIYQLEMADANGCTVSDIIRIFVEKDINVFIPSAFSPDGDGNNDILMVYADQSVASVESFQVFDRWGNQVYINGPFQPNDPNYGWDGRLNGEIMNAAVFVYFAQIKLVNGEEVMLKGEVVLLR